jgi:hypothetical protein
VYSARSLPPAAQWPGKWSANSAIMQRAGLIFFGAFFVFLSAGVALAVGIGSPPSVPRDAVAIVEGAPPDLNLITKAEFDHEMRVQALEGGMKGVPPPGSLDYETLKRSAMSKVIGVVWVEAQAKQMGLEPTPREIVEKLSPGEGKAIKELGLTQRDADDRMRWYLAGDKIQEMLRERVREPSGVEIRDYYEENRQRGESLAEAREEIVTAIKTQRESELFSRVETRFRSEWRTRTYCAEGFIVEGCSNYPSFDHPITALLACYEADPKEPAEECPAPVIASRPAQPGSVRWWQPEGERLAQGPVPPGGGEGEAPVE